MNGHLIAFAKEITRSKPADLPEKFLQLERRHCFSSSSKRRIRHVYGWIPLELLQRSPSTTSLKHDLIALDILPVLLLTLQQDFTLIPNGWRLASINLSPLAW